MPFIMPAGLSPLGLAVPLIPGARLPPPVIAAEAVNPASRDVASLLVGMDVIDAQVQLALSVLRNSGPAVAAVGQRFRDVLKLEDRAANLLENQARTALSLLVSRGDIVIDAVGVAVDPSNAFAEVTVEYINQRASGDKTRQHTVRTEASTR